MGMRYLTGCVCALVISLVARTASAAESCDSLAGRLVSVEGRVEIQRADGQPWLPAELNQQVCQGDTIRVANRGRAAVALINDGYR